MRNTSMSRVGILVLRLVLLEMLAVLFDAAGSAATQSATVRAQAVVSCSAPATTEQQASCAALEQQDEQHRAQQLARSSVAFLRSCGLLVEWKQVHRITPSSLPSTRSEAHFQYGPLLGPLSPR